MKIDIHVQVRLAHPDEEWMRVNGNIRIFCLDFYGAEPGKRQVRAQIDHGEKVLWERWGNQVQFQELRESTMRNCPDMSQLEYKILRSVLENPCWETV